MKTKIFVISALIAFSYANAQENSHTDIQIKKYSKRIDSIVVSEKAKMNDELNTLDENFKANKLSSEEKQKQRNEIASKYEQIINSKVDDEKANLEIATKEIVKNAVLGNGQSNYAIIVGEDNAILSFRDPKKTKKELLNAYDVNLAFGFIDLNKSASSLSVGGKDSDMRFGKSASTDFEFRITKQFGKLTSPVFYRFGFGYRGDTFVPKNSQVFLQENDEISLTDFTLGKLKKSRFVNHYLVVPLDFVFVLNPKYTVENGERILDNSKGNFRVSAGVYGGVRVLSQNQIIYKNADDRRVRITETINEGTNNFLFGGKVALGYGGFNIFVKKDFTPIFNDDARLGNKYGFQIGIELLYINL
ncbi:hypothetical protein AR438_09425 [Chryseobacterium aquaticum]|uniref:Outer membrane protein beta-barrel domain-containing protein n=1 Tax=Chryseobacterium aquaticum TaxID=452084 RepID=A0A0Q3KNX5_9FLAO|nr:hypothetical protein [Chryseobacterium aquaticum]KQK25804.1 hypothetical protein AR438_09425 [Chryseobacterium aquaticum]